jgi:hypothetical protein
MGTWSTSQGISCFKFDTTSITVINFSIIVIQIQGEKQKQLFAHPAVKCLLMEFFFTGRNSDGYHDIDAFGPAIPLPTIALLIAAVRSHSFIYFHLLKIHTVESLLG